MHNRKNFAIGSLIAKSEDTRFALASLQIHPDKTVACDGHILALVSDTKTQPQDFPLIDGVTPTAEFDPFLIPAAQAAAITKAIPNERLLTALNNAQIGVNGDGKSKVIATTDLEAKTVFKVEEETDPAKKHFPVWDRAIPETEPIATVTFDLNLLLPALKALAAFGPDRVKTATMRVYASDKDLPDRICTPVRFDSQNWQTEQHMTVVVMPFNDVVPAKDWAGSTN
jgi:hypothetical protein